MSTEGGTTDTMGEAAETLTKETHRALLEQAVRDATATATQESATATSRIDQLSAHASELDTEVAALRSDNQRLNLELDTAQLRLKSATDEVATLKADMAARDEAAARADVASRRAEQVRTLGLFEADYIGRKADDWASDTEEAWLARLDEWRQLKPAGTNGAASGARADVASAMSGTSEDLTTTPAAVEDKSPRRAVLGLEPRGGAR